MEEIAHLAGAKELVGSAPLPAATRDPLLWWDPRPSIAAGRLAMAKHLLSLVIPIGVDFVAGFQYATLLLGFRCWATSSWMVGSCSTTDRTAVVDGQDLAGGDRRQGANPSWAPNSAGRDLAARWQRLFVDDCTAGILQI
ncbi:hypothetical protein ACLOJK_000525 [Asimina triloba]